jgi:general secretion pathway protein G
LPQPTASPGKGGKFALWGILIAVGCFVSVAILGIIAAIFIPNFVDALNKAKVKRSMADMREVNVALADYASEYGSYPDADSMDALALALRKENDTTFPRLDGWQRPFRYACLERRGAGCFSYGLASAGRDGVFEHENLRDYSENQLPREEYDRDLVALDSVFIQYPAGR